MHVISQSASRSGYSIFFNSKTTLILNTSTFLFVNLCSQNGFRINQVPPVVTDFGFVVAWDCL